MGIIAFFFYNILGSVLASPMEDKLEVFPEEPISPPSPTSPDARSKSPSSPTSKEGRFKYLRKRLSTGTSRPKNLPMEGEEGTVDLYEQKYRQVSYYRQNFKLFEGKNYGFMFYFTLLQF